MAETDDPTTTPETDVPAVALAEPETTPTAAAPASPQPVAQAPRRGFIAPFLGGVLAAGAGFGLAQYVPNGWPLPDTAALEASLKTQADDIAALKAGLAKSADPSLAPRLAALEGVAPVDLAPLAERVAELTQRVATIETLPADGSTASPAAIAALGDTLRRLEAEVAELKANASGATPALAVEVAAQLKEAEAKAAQIKAEAEALAAETAARAALARLQAALDTGAAYAEHLPALGADIPPALSDHAETGLPSLARLQESFPEAARAALDAAIRADMGESWTERATSFLRSQTGARSLAPREGDDPDAILSRAEAALTTGDLVATLAELAALPEAALPAMADWRALAEQRRAGEEAVKTIATAIGG